MIITAGDVVSSTCNVTIAARGVIIAAHGVIVTAYDVHRHRLRLHPGPPKAWDDSPLNCVARWPRTR